LWQTITEAFEQDRTKRNFSDDHIGRGGPGAVVALALGAYHSDPSRNPGEADNAFFDRVVGGMLTDLRPGAVLQFWDEEGDFLSIKGRTATAGLVSFGHSPIFVRYDGPANAPTGIVIIDQFGESVYPVIGSAHNRNRRMQWGAASPQIWIAANWEE
ncbi:MAG: hypothetical protein M3O70_18560, partial [Actinomycetota bacterium]|nr:hypothetical protein [Actinomycetota bacterium]